MPWKWAAAAVVLICGVYLLVSKVLNPNDLIVLQRPIKEADPRWTSLIDGADSFGGDDGGASIVRPKLLNSKHHVRIKRRSNYNDETKKNVVGARMNTNGANISIKFDEYLVSSLLTEDYYLYRMNIFGDEVVINLTRLTSNDTDIVFAPSFILQHLDTNYTWITSNSTNSFVDHCLYTGRIVENSTTTVQEEEEATNQNSQSWRGSILLNLCRGMYGVLELPQGTYFLEPLHNVSEGQSLIPDDQPHLLYRHRSHTFHDYYRSSRSIYPNLNQRNVNENTYDGHSDKPHSGRRRKKSTSWDHYVEVLVVADAQMRRYHRNNLENYVLTLLSIVATIYRHPSLDAALNIVVVRLIVLDHENAGPKINENAQDTLKQFCRWQQTLNDDDDDSINHHDVAILLTRHDICRAPGKCDTLGLAELGTMCDTYRSCAIIEDNGLSAAFTIAHELGHIFNIPHDDEKKCSQFMTLDKFNFHIMAPTLEYNTHPWSWSPCSSSILRHFLDEKAYCLFDKPVQQTYSQQMVANPAPGLNFSVHQQCQYVFGPSSQLCPFMPTCKRLWCTNAYSYQIQAGCRTQHMPWADGTPCAYNKWCYRGECMAVSPDQLTPIDGEWGTWRDWGECSRICDGGIEKAVRSCDNPSPSNGGKFCIGERVRYRSCNKKECPDDAPDFREVQCSEFNGNRHNITNVAADVKWVPRYSGINPNDRCKLYCAIDGGSDFYLLKSKVVDGTNCGRDTDDICVDGICREAGCDFLLGSRLKRDECGVCGGDGKTCKKETGIFNGQTTYGYNSVIKIPAGVNNLDIRQKAWNDKNNDDNYLALLNSKGEFILNGHFQVTVFQQQIRVRGSILEYSGSDTAIERINSSRPILEDLFLHVLAVGQLRPPNINWEYLTQDKTLLSLAFRVSYEWRTKDEWTPCDKHCHGSQKQKLFCIQTSDNQPTDDVNCENSRKPDVHQRVCNMHCQLRWSLETLTSCNAICGSGELTQRSFCVETITDGQENRIDDVHCQQLDRPLDKITCYNDCAGRHWAYSEWDRCSQTCNGGVQRREARCNDQTEQILDNRYCDNLAIEPTERQCNIVPCPTWRYGEWSKCTHSCDGGVQVRTATCHDMNDRVVDGRLCDTDKRLEERKKCNENLCTKWKFEPWSECSTTCGDSVATRNAQCVDSKDNILDDSMCVVAQKLVAKPCKLIACPKWRLGEWTACSQTCLDGWNSRRVECVDANDQAVELNFCGSPNEVPPAHKPCNFGPCPFWRVQDWNPCSVSCGNGHQDRSVDCIYKDDVVDVSYCPNAAQPPKQRSCVLTSCPEWEIGGWDTCSVSCGQGHRQRIVKCIFPDTRISTDDELCNQNKKPKTIVSCEIVACTILPTTVTTEAPVQSLRRSSVSPSLDHFTSTKSSPRVLYHHDPSTLSARYTVSKQSTAYASGSDASPTRWEMGAWSECSVTCGEGEQMRYVACRDIFLRILPDIYCGHQDKPTTAEACVRNTCGEWQIGEWQPCSVTCGEGHHTTTRQVTCVAPSTENVLEWSYCDPGKRPVDKKECSIPACNVQQTSNDIETDLMDTGWRVGDWGQCSQTCGGDGWQQRLVLCVPGFGPVPIVYCSLSDKPIELRPCRQNSCPIWMFGGWGQCNRTCGGGYQERIVECVNPDDGQIVPWQNCSQPMPLRVQSCNLHKCRHHGVWKLGKWSTCSAVCGRGKRTRTVQCIDEESGFVYRNETFCIQPKPVDHHRCRMVRCPRWKGGKWSLCSVSCGEGIRNRQVYCTQGRKNIVSHKKCGNLTKPNDTTHCRLPSCPTYNWITTRWSRCSQQCGDGRQVREVYCVNNLFQKAPPGACNLLKKPLAVQNCVGPKCPYAWVPGPWTTCSRSCDAGEQFRNLHCQIKPYYVYQIGSTTTERGPQVADHYCASLPKPTSRYHCSLGACESDIFWQTEAWSHCSVTCGWGFQQRKIFCTDKNSTRISRNFCGNITSELRPRRRRRCFARNCDPTNCAEVKELLNATVDSLYDIMVGGRNVKIYCFGMITSTPMEYLPLPSGIQTNYAEFYGKRLMFPFTCPNNGSRNDSCYCTEKGNPKPGLTRYSHVRLDLYHMKINAMDSQFAITEFGDFVSYATAGDCYSAVNCPQGRFSVDLRGTGFKVSDKTTWKEDGHRVASKITRFENGAIVRGMCGGYCGKCYPDKRIGFEIELDSEQF